MEKLQGLYVPEDLLDNHKDHIKVMTQDEFNNFIKSLNEIGTDKGSSCVIHYVNNSVYKEYIEEPVLYNISDLWLDFEAEKTGKDAVKNLFNLLSINRKNSATPEVIYVVDNILRMYKTKKMPGILVDNITTDDEIVIMDLLLAWIEAYKEAEFYSENGILMYDLNTSNALLDKNSLKFIDLDFYTKEEIDDYEENVEAVNLVFKDLIERYLKDKKFKCRKPDYLIYTKDYLQDTYDELCLQAGTKTCKTLKEVSRHI